MSKEIAPEVFDFIDELSDELRQGSSSSASREKQDSISLTFCGTFFEQFFGTVGRRIVGFSMASKRGASTYAEQISNSSDKSHVRRVIVRYEELCDKRIDLVSDYGSENVSETQMYFYTEYLVDLLATALDWAKTENLGDLTERIAKASTNYDDAVGSSSW